MYDAQVCNLTVCKCACASEPGRHTHLNNLTKIMECEFIVFNCISSIEVYVTDFMCFKTHSMRFNLYF